MKKKLLSQSRSQDSLNLKPHRGLCKNCYNLLEFALNCVFICM